MGDRMLEAVEQLVLHLDYFSGIYRLCMNQTNVKLDFLASVIKKLDDVILTNNPALDERCMSFLELSQVKFCTDIISFLLFMQ